MPSSLLPAPLARTLRSAFAAGLGVIAAGFAARAADLDQIRAAKLLRVGLPAADTPAFLIRQPGGSLGGLEGELLQDLARRMDVRLELIREARTGDELVAQVAAGRVDVAVGQLPDALEWAKHVRFTLPYVTLFEVRLIDRLASVRAGGVAALLQRPEARLAAAAGSPAVPLLRESLGTDRLLVTPTLEDALEAVAAARAVGVVGDDVSLSRWLDGNAAAGIRWEIQARRDRPLTLAMAVSWQAERLHTWLNLYLEKGTYDETLRNLAVKHLGKARLEVAK